MSSTPLRPEQRRALLYLERKGTRASLESLRQRVGATLGTMEDLISDLDSKRAAERPAAGGWSVHEVVDHLEISHRRGIAQLRQLIAGRSPADGAVPAGLQSEDPFARPWPRLRADLVRVHEDLRSILRTVDEHGADEKARQPGARGPVAMVLKLVAEGGEVELLQWTECFEWRAFVLTLRVHTLEHVRQVERILGSAT